MRLLYALLGTPAHGALRRLHMDGRVVAGSSAGAMVMGGHMQRGGDGEWIEALALAPGIAVIPHADESGVTLDNGVSLRTGLAWHGTLLAIDQQTVVLELGDGASWLNLGPGHVTVIPPVGDPAMYHAGDELDLPFLMHGGRAIMACDARSATARGACASAAAVLSCPPDHAASTAPPALSLEPAAEEDIQPWVTGRGPTRVRSSSARAPPAWQRPPV